jgi:hypothetical protein
MHSVHLATYVCFMWWRDNDTVDSLAFDSVNGIELAWSVSAGNCLLHAAASHAARVRAHVPYALVGTTCARYPTAVHYLFLRWAAHCTAGCTCCPYAV